MCEDCFDNMVVFSDVWWIGKKDENPEEAQLDFPKELSEGQPTDYDFKGGAGVVSKGVPKIATRYTEQQSPEANKDDLDDEKNLNDKIQETPLRQSKRNAQKKFKFVEVSSEDEFVGTDADVFEIEEEKACVKVGTSTGNDILGEFNNSCPKFVGNESEVPAEMQSSTPIELSTMSATNTQKLSRSAVSASKEKSNTLVQATISTLFKKADEKVSRNLEKSSSSRGRRLKLQDNDLKRKIDEGKESRKKRKVIVKNTGTKAAFGKKEYEEEDDDDIDEFSSTPKDTNGSDEDWAV